MFTLDGIGSSAFVWFSVYWPLRVWGFLPGTNGKNGLFFGEREPESLLVKIVVVYLNLISVKTTG